MDMEIKSRFDHFNINVTDLARSLDFYDKALGLKDKLPTMTEDEQLALLATDGMLVKRPLLVADDLVLVGFREKEWEERL